VDRSGWVGVVKADVVRTMRAQSAAAVAHLCGTCAQKQPWALRCCPCEKERHSVSTATHMH
jgi:hypothetical protein